MKLWLVIQGLLFKVWFLWDIYGYVTKSFINNKMIINNVFKNNIWYNKSLIIGKS